MIVISQEQADNIRRGKWSHMVTHTNEASTIRAIAAAEAFTDAINEMGFDVETFAKVVAGEHRTLQQGAMRCFVEFAKQMAKSYEDQRYDARNEGACKLASEIVKIDSYLPSI